MSPTKKTRSTKTAGEAVAVPDFETTLNELEDLLEKMETGELSLEASLEAFERGVKLTRVCQATLKQAELRIQTLTLENQDIVPGDQPADKTPEETGEA